MSKEIKVVELFAGVVPDNSVAVGVPARVIKTIRDDQLAHNIENAKAYVEMGRQHAAL